MTFILASIIYLSHGYCPIINNAQVYQFERVERRKNGKKKAA